jgi:hypothetical protein
MWVMDLQVHRELPVLYTFSFPPNAVPTSRELMHELLPGFLVDSMDNHLLISCA